MNLPQHKIYSPEWLAKQPRALPKRVFIQEYVLNRARAMPGSLSGEGAAEEALRAWDVIERGYE